MKIPLDFFLRLIEKFLNEHELDNVVKKLKKHFETPEEDFSDILSELSLQEIISKYVKENKELKKKIKSKIKKYMEENKNESEDDKPSKEEKEEKLEQIKILNQERMLAIRKNIMNDKCITYELLNKIEKDNFDINEDNKNLICYKIELLGRFFKFRIGVDFLSSSSIINGVGFLIIFLPFFFNFGFGLLFEFVTVLLLLVLLVLLLSVFLSLLSAFSFSGVLSLFCAGFVCLVLRWTFCFGDLEPNSNSRFNISSINLFGFFFVSNIFFGVLILLLFFLLSNCD